MSIKSIIANDPLVKMITGKSATPKKRKKTLTAAQKRSVKAQVNRAKSKAYKAGLNARRTRR